MIDVDEPSVTTTRDILEKLRYTYQEYHDVYYKEEALDECIKIADRKIHYRMFPDKAIDLMDEVASAKVIKHQNKKMHDLDVLEISKSDVLEFVSSALNIPIETLNENTIDKINRIEQQMKMDIIGQDEAIDKMMRCMARKECGFVDNTKPIASFMLYGDTCCGKTSMAMKFGELYDMNVIRLDMSEYMDDISISSLIGSNPGYVGYEEGGILTNAIKRNPFSVIIFDEFEKAHPLVYNLLLQILDDGRLSDNKGDVYSFKNSIIILTSNVGSNANNMEFGLIKYEERDEKDHNELKSYFLPEFLNRFDHLIKFKKIEQKKL